MMTQEKKILEAMIAKIKERRGIRMSAKSEQKERGEGREKTRASRRRKKAGERWQEIVK